MKNKKFKISVIVPIYNVEQYLEECLNSVINQTIGFEDNIQLILVNDGSPDNSDKICLEYKKRYPHNVVYINQLNAGVSAARNKGLEFATGEIVNFLDSDDIWEEDVFVKAYDMLSSNNDVDIVGVRLKFFGGMEGYHALDYKFDKDKIVDISMDYDHIQLSSASCFIKRKAIGNNKFDTRLKYSEDVKFISEILLKKMKLGIIASSLYLYRRRVEENSAIQTKSFSESWYTDTPRLCYKYLFDLSIKKYGAVLPYIQYCVAYDYQWRVRDHIPDSISEKVISDYVNLSKELFKNIDAHIILEQKKMNLEYKVLVLKEKYGKNYDKHITVKKGVLYFDKYVLYNVSNKHVINIRVLKIKNNKLILKGLVNSLIDIDNYDIVLRINGKDRILKLFDTNIHVRKFFGKDCYHNMGFDFSIDVSELKSIEIYIRYAGELLKLNPTFSIFGKLSDKLPLHYVESGYTVTNKNNVITVSKTNIFRNICLEIKLYILLLKKHKHKHVLYRICYHMLRLFKRKKIWLISDKLMSADDSGMHLFKYIVNHNKKDDVYFVLDKKSSDYQTMQSVGKVIDYNSFKYKVYFLMSRFVISSQDNIGVYNPFGKSFIYYTDLYNFDYVFLQHGITKDDISEWLNVYTRDFSMFVTGAKQEYNSIINNKDYGYNSNVVKLTGLPRYDGLEDDAHKQIVIMPTWRKQSAGVFNSDNGEWDYSFTFKNSDYYRFYDRLINDKRLLKTMHDNGYKGLFVLHSAHISNAKDFNGNELFEVVDTLKDYQKSLVESALLVSDYSSVSFDFAYMKKPVIYTQFDKEDFYKSHIYNEGYFSYEKDGFGPVLYDYDSTVDAIIKYIEKDCVMEDKYKKRVDKFFCYTDKNNCERVYEAILNMESNDKKTK